MSDAERPDGSPGPPGPQPPPGNPYGPPAPGPAGYNAIPGTPPYSPQPGDDKKPKAPLILVAAGVAFLLLVGLTIAALAGRDSDVATGPGGRGLDAAAEKPSDAVRGYLEALAAGDADRAIGYLDTVPADRSFLTREVLEVSAKKAPLTAIDVPEVTDQFTSGVPARYTLGKEAVSEGFNVTESGGRWKISRGVTELDLGDQRDQTLPLLINGVKVTTDTVALFPGHYAFTTTSKWVTYDDLAALTLTGPSDYTSPRLTPTLTSEAKTAFLKATKTALNKCLDQRKLAPSGCPNRLQARSNQKVDRDTVRWTLTNDPYQNARVTLDSTDPTVAAATLSPRYNFRAEGTQDGRRATFDGPPIGLFSFRATGDLSKDSIKVKLSTR